MEIAQTMIVSAIIGVVGLQCGLINYSGTIWESLAIEGESPVHEIFYIPSSILSRAGHVESCLNLPEPSGKAKYSSETDSERVP